MDGNAEGIAQLCEETKEEMAGRVARKARSCRSGMAWRTAGQADWSGLPPAVASVPYKAVRLVRVAAPGQPAQRMQIADTRLLALRSCLVMQNSNATICGATQSTPYGQTDQAPHLVQVLLPVAEGQVDKVDLEAAPAGQRERHGGSGGLAPVPLRLSVAGWLDAERMAALAALAAGMQ